MRRTIESLAILAHGLQVWASNMAQTFFLVLLGWWFQICVVVIHARGWLSNQLTCGFFWTGQRCPPSSFCSDPITCPVVASIFFHLEAAALRKGDESLFGQQSAFWGPWSDVCGPARGASKGWYSLLTSRCQKRDDWMCGYFSQAVGEYEWICMWHNWFSIIDFFFWSV